MNSRTRLSVLAVAGVVCALAATAAERPNILLVLSDDHSASHVGCYGSPNAITPNIDRFAAEGMRFTRAYSTSPQCAPSRASIFAGRSPVALGVTRFAQPVPKDTVFFTDLLRRHGYWAGIDGRHHHLDGKRDEREESHVVAALQESGLKYLPERFDHVRILSTAGEENLAALPRRFDEALDKVPAGKPFFLYFGMNQPHRPWRADPRGVNFDSARLKLPPDFPDLPEIRADYAQFLRSVYDLDRAFGVLMQGIEQHGLKENTLVVFMGDNGEALLRGKGTLYDRGTHVPLIIRWPKVVRAGAESDALVSGEDLAATLLEAVGLAAPKAMTSVSFLPVLKSQPFVGRRHVFAERGWHAGPITRTDGLDLSRSITTRRYRLIYNVLPDRVYTQVDMVNTPAWAALVETHRQKRLTALHERLLFAHPRPVFELYDLVDDPHELNNLANQELTKQTESELRDELAKWMVREGDYLPLPSIRPR